MKMRAFSFRMVEIFVLIQLFWGTFALASGAQGLSPTLPLQNPYLSLVEQFIGAIGQLGSEAGSLSGAINGARSEFASFEDTYLKQGALFRMGLTLGLGVGVGVICVGVACYGSYKAWQHRDHLVAGAKDTGAQAGRFLGCSQRVRVRADTEEPLTDTAVTIETVN